MIKTFIRYCRSGILYHVLPLSNKDYILLRSTLSSSITLGFILWIFQFWSDIHFGRFRARKKMYKAKCIIWISSCTLHLMLHTWFRDILLGLSQRTLMHYIIDTFITTSQMHITAFLWHFSFHTKYNFVSRQLVLSQRYMHEFTWYLHYYFIHIESDAS